ncbi:MAG: RDD family protein [Halanaerobiales bacterium]
MECKTCNTELQAGVIICSSCSSLIIDGNLKLGSPVRRLIAYFVDYILMVGLLLLSLAGVEYMSVILIALGIAQLYMQTKSTSLGKRLMGMFVVDKQGKRVGFGKMFLRETFGKILSGMIFSLGYLWILIDDNNQAWHDKFINSIVVTQS